MSGYNGPGNFGAPQQGPYGQQPDPYGQPGPYGQQPGPYGQQPYQQQQGPYGGGPGGYGPYGPGGGRPPRTGAGFGAGLAIAVVGAGIYAFMISEADDTFYGWMAIIIGLAIGGAVGKFGGRHNALPVLAVVLTGAAVFLAQYFGIAMFYADKTPLSVSEVIDKVDITEIWKNAMEEDGNGVMFGIGVVISGVVAKVVGDQS